MTVLTNGASGQLSFIFLVSETEPGPKHKNIPKVEPSLLYEQKAVWHHITCYEALLVLHPVEIYYHRHFKHVNNHFKCVLAPWHSSSSLNAGFGFPLLTCWDGRPPLRIRNDQSYAHSKLTFAPLLAADGKPPSAHTPCISQQGRLRACSRGHGDIQPNTASKLSISVYESSWRVGLFCCQVWLGTHLQVNAVVSSLCWIARSMLLSHGWHHPTLMREGAP